MRHLLIITSLLLMTFFSCKTTGIDFSQITKIEYRFNNSSVPPQYHRSYSILVTETELQITVDSYGDILAEKRIELDKNRFAELLLELNRSGVKSGPERNSKGCTGGTSEEFKCWTDASLILTGYVAHCGGQDTGNLYGDLPSFAKSLKALIPDFADLLK